MRRSAASVPSRASGRDTSPRRTRRSSEAPRACRAAVAFGSARAPATARCVSSASRAMKSRMISEEPSKIRLMRASRSMRSTGIGASPRFLERVGRLVAAPAPDLERPVHDRPALLRVPHLRDGRLEAEVPVVRVGHGRAHLGHGVHRERRRGHLREELRDRVVPSDRLAPLHALSRPRARDLETALRRGRRRRRES